jgi:hypothetical protein
MAIFSPDQSGYAAYRTILDEESGYSPLFSPSPSLLRLCAGGRCRCNAVLSTRLTAQQNNPPATGMKRQAVTRINAVAP